MGRSTSIQSIHVQLIQMDSGTIWNAAIFAMSRNAGAKTVNGVNESDILLFRRLES